jgi:hypothetical protein
VTFGEAGTARVLARGPARYQIELRLVDGRWRATPETAAAAKLFGIR